MLLEEIKKETDGDSEIIHRLQLSKKPILIYGCANHAELVYKYLCAHGLEVEAYVVDSQYWKEDFFIGTIPVKKIDDYQALLDEYNIVIGFCEVEKSRFLMNNIQLLKGNYCLLWEPLVTYEWDAEYLQENWGALCDVYENLADEVSKKILHELIWAKLNVSGERILRLADNRQYFNELTFMHDSSKEVFVDCGAFDGDTIMKYAAFTSGIYKKIFAFEPNEENGRKLKKNVGKLVNVEIINKGTWKEDAVLEFEENGSASQIIDEGRGITVDVTTIDKIVGEEKVTFIKMDVEGSELESLEGAAETIRRNMPKLAICCYHKRNDILNLYHYIKNFNNEESVYKFYLRHHSNSVYETVLYAIPVKRGLENIL